MSLYENLLTYEPQESTSKTKRTRSTQIIATINEMTTEIEAMNLASQGVNIACFPVDEQSDGEKIKTAFEIVKKGTGDYIQNRCNIIKGKLAPKDQNSFKCTPVHVATALDIKGSYLQTGKFAQPAIFQNEVTLTNNESEKDNCNNLSVFIDFPELSSLPEDQIVVLGEGSEQVWLKVISQENDGTLKASTEKTGKLDAQESHRVVLRGAKFQLPGIIDKVMQWVDFCKNEKIDMIFVPVSDAKTFLQIVCMINADESGAKLKIIAKLEGQDAVDNVELINTKADGVMFPRQKLSEVIKLEEQLIIHQKNVIAKCLKCGVPSIVANDLLKTMETAEEATRAEMADVFNAVLDGADCTMLDQKKVTHEMVNNITQIIVEAEDIINYRRLNRELLSQVAISTKKVTEDNTETIAIAACTAAMINDSKAIIVLTDNGKTIPKISKFRPECPIIAVADDEAVARQCLLNRGVYAVVHGKIISKIMNFLLSILFRTKD